jgi:hypothetical protein
MIPEAVIVPTFERSEFLYVCLEAIRTVEPKIPIHVFPDRGTDETEICEKFNAVHHLTLKHSYHGNSFNVLEALKWAYHQGIQLTYVIEDDAIIDSSLFTWSRDALAKSLDSFAACGWRYSPDAIISDGPDLKIPWYLSVCAAIPRRSLFGIVQHARLEYYSDMQGYLDRAYPASNRRGSMHYEQDGLVLRVMESENKRCVWPRRPCATHCGFRGYHMSSDRPEGTLEERVAILKLALKQPALLTKLMSGGKVPDLAKCEGCGKPLVSSDKVSKIICCDCFHVWYPDYPQTSTSHYYLKPVSAISG